MRGQNFTAMENHIVQRLAKIRYTHKTVGHPITSVQGKIVVK